MRRFTIKAEKTLNFSVCGQLISKENFLHMKRKINENVLIFVQQGKLYINSNNKNFEISENQFIFLKAEEEHFGYRESPGELKYFWVHFKDELQELGEEEVPFQQDLDYFFPETGTIYNSSRLILLFRQMMDFSLEEWNQNKKILNFSLSIFVMEFSKEANSTHKKTNKNNSIINDICNWLKLNFQNDFSLEELSSNFNLQSNYLSKIFKTTMKKSIIQYTTELRIQAAKNLLPNFSVKETAYSCGFQDEKYFMKVFKKNEGITPTEYKQAFSLQNINQ